MPQAPADPHRAYRAPDDIARMFDRIAGRYDLLNRVLSAGRDRVWRARAVESLRLRGGETVLDLCTGTADLLLALAPPHGPAGRVVGVDFSAGMLRLGQRKVRRSTARGALTLLQGDAERLPLGGGSVDGVTIGFGIRNVHDRGAALAEVRRVLRPGGRLAILEFGAPGPAPLRALYLWYFQRVLPLVGRLVSRHASAYSYLPASVGAFPAPAAFCAMLEQAGFADVRCDPLTLGIVCLYTARAS